MEEGNLNIAELIKQTLSVSNLAEKKPWHEHVDWKDQLCSVVNLIPLVGGFFAAEIKNVDNIISNYRASEFLRKFTRFILELDDFNDEERCKFMQEIESAAGDTSGNVMLSIIDGMDNINKQKVLANLVKAKGNGDISIEDFFRLESVLRRIPYVDLQQLENYQSEYYDEYGDTELLNSTGVLRPAKYNVEGDKYVLSPLGVSLLKWGLGVSVCLPNISGTATVEVPSTEPIPDSEIDKIFEDATERKNYRDSDQAMFGYDDYRGK